MVRQRVSNKFANPKTPITVVLTFHNMPWGAPFTRSLYEMLCCCNKFFIQFPVLPVVLRHTPAFERVILEAAPNRTMRVAHRHVSGNDTVIIEAVLFDSSRGEDWNIPFTAVLTCEKGRVVEDRTYADWRQWPGL